MRFAVAALVLLALPGTLGAQPATRPEGSDGAVRVLFPETMDPHDPLSTGQLDALREVPEPPAPPTAAELPPVAPGVEADEGAVLTAIPGVRETAHDVRVSLRRDGLAVVSVELRIASRSRFAAEVRYRLAVPPGAAPVSFEVCQGDEGPCRPASPDVPEGAYHAALGARPADGAQEPLPVAALALEEGAFVLRAAPVPPRGALRLRLRYVAPTTQRGGTVRLTLPPRGSDLRAMAASVRLEVEGLLAPSLQRGPAAAPVDVDPWEPIELAAAVPSGGLTSRADLVGRGAARRARFFLSAAPEGSRPLDALLLLDVSPSMSGPPLGRLGPALRALLATAPAGSRFRVAALAARAEVLVAEAREAAELPVDALLGATHLELGASTRLESVLDLLDDLERAPRELVLVGDGGVTQGPGFERFARSVRRRGLRLSLVRLAERAPDEALLALVRRSGGGEVSLAEVEGAGGRRGRAALEEALLALYAPTAAAPRLGRADDLGPLRAGESRVVWAAPDAVLTFRRRPALRPRAARGDDARLLAALAAPRPLVAAEPGELACLAPALAGGVSTDAEPVALAEPRTCGDAGPDLVPPPPAPPAREAGRGVPPGSLLAMLRARVVPAARGCFRQDRRGRLDYAVRAEFVFVLADQEVTSAEVRGELPDALRACLRGAMDGLDVPPFEGRVVVRYPLRTRRVAPEPALELREGPASTLDALFGDEPTRPRRPRP
ncbi:MAG: vWA domain-containing protein [Myxococcota bacterium]